MTKATHHHIRGLILDMDGVLWRDHQPIGNLPAIFDRIRSSEIAFRLLTNNSTKSIAQYIDTFHDLGVTLTEDEILNTAKATALHLQSQFPEGGGVYVVGENGLVETLADHGFLINDHKVVAVVAGLDRSFDYPKLHRAQTLILNGAEFIGTNPDRTIPSPDGLAPGAGSMLAAIEAATNRPPVIIGKPKPEMFIQAMARMRTSPSETLVVGDRLETDIAGGQAAGCLTALVLTGVTTEESAGSWTPPPDFIVSDLSHLLNRIL